jgi:hypothetical protein
MRKLHFGIIISVIALAAAGASANAQTAAPKSEIEVDGIYAIPSGSANFSATTSSGATISFADDFGLKNRLGFGLRYTYRSENGKHKFWLTYNRTTNTNTRTLSRTFTFLDQTYTANLNTRAEQSLGIFLASYAYRWGNKKVRIGPMGQLGFATARVDLNAVTNNAVGARSGKITTAVGTVGYDMDINPTDKVNIFNNVGFFKLSNDRFLRGEFGVRYYPSHTFGVSGGYQFGRYKVVDNQNFIRANEHGPFFGGLFRF